MTSRHNERVRSARERLVEQQRAAREEERRRESAERERRREHEARQRAALENADRALAGAQSARATAAAALAGAAAELGESLVAELLGLPPGEMRALLREHRAALGPGDAPADAQAQPDRSAPAERARVDPGERPGPATGASVPAVSDPRTRN